MPGFHLFHLAFEWGAAHAVVPAACRQAAFETIAPLLTAAWAYDAHTIAVRTGKRVVLLYLAPNPGSYGVSAYSTQNATARQSVVAEACRDFTPMTITRCGRAYYLPTRSCDPSERSAVVKRYFHDLSVTGVGWL